MWAQLTDSSLVKFYRELHEGRYERGEDWLPMVRAIEYLQSQDFAKELFGFTSLAHFQITTSPSYEEQEGHSCVGVSWDYQTKLFGLSFWKLDNPSGDGQNKVIRCAEQDFPSAVDALILRLDH